MNGDWGIRIQVGLLPAGEPKDILDMLLDNLVLTRTSGDDEWTVAYATPAGEVEMGQVDLTMLFGGGGNED